MSKDGQGQKQRAPELYITGSALPYSTRSIYTLSLVLYPIITSAITKYDLVLYRGADHKPKRKGRAMTQTEKVLERLKKGETISTYDAFIKHGITRLSARIYEIRQLGYDIGNVHVTKKNPDGSRSNYDLYFLKNKEK